jgi:hypothetical protein
MEEREQLGSILCNGYGARTDGTRANTAAERRPPPSSHASQRYGKDRARVGEQTHCQNRIQLGQQLRSAENYPNLGYRHPKVPIQVDVEERAHRAVRGVTQENNRAKDQENAEWRYRAAIPRAARISDAEDVLELFWLLFMTFLASGAPAPGPRGWRLFRRWKCRSRGGTATSRSRRSGADRDHLPREQAVGTERIRGELPKLGIIVSSRSIRR